MDLIVIYLYGSLWDEVGWYIFVLYILCVKLKFEIFNFLLFIIRMFLVVKFL